MDPMLESGRDAVPPAAARSFTTPTASAMSGRPQGGPPPGYQGPPPGYQGPPPPGYPGYQGPPQGYPGYPQGGPPPGWQGGPVPQPATPRPRPSSGKRLFSLGIPFLIFGVDGDHRGGRAAGRRGPVPVLEPAARGLPARTAGRDPGEPGVHHLRPQRRDPRAVRLRRAAGGRPVRATSRASSSTRRPRSRTAPSGRTPASTRWASCRRPSTR